MPLMPDEFVQTVSERYIELYEMIVGEKFQPIVSESITERINQNVKTFLSESKE